VNEVRSARILLVEDDEVAATLLVELLGKLGDVHWTASAEQASEIVGGRDWDLVVSDIDLPGLDGLELVRRVKQQRPQLATLILSGHSSFDYAVAAMRAGADDYLTKPFDPPGLIEKARALIAVTRERRAAGQQIVLAVGAHPDDVEIGIGGILLRHAAQGHNVTVLTLTGGEAGGRTADRAAEAAHAAELLGARLIHAGLTDTSVSEGGSTIGTILEVVEDIRPSTVYTHTIRDVHQDHRNAHSATLVAARGISRVFCYQAPSTTVEFKPTRFVVIDEFLEGKIEVIQAYTSQVKIRDYLDEELLRATARYWSRFATARYVEPLEVVRDSDEAVVATAVQQQHAFELPRQAIDAG
jgi:LmbE family N-acetylglucosaminyl deacetylase/ActR/RegA family two-component response regulator